MQEHEVHNTSKYVCVCVYTLEDISIISKGAYQPAPVAVFCCGYFTVATPKKIM